jgi:hypothetical protein
MTAPLTVHNAQVTTATVQIRTLTVSGKQVTLAVFRQLIEEPLVTEDGKLAGLPWGTVNYHPDKCADYSRHLHVVWQDGDELRRSYVREPGSWAPFTVPADVPGDGAGVLDMLVQAAYCLNDHKDPSWFSREYAVGSRCIRFQLDGMLCATRYEPDRDGHMRYRPGRAGYRHTCLGAEAGDAAADLAFRYIGAERERRGRIEAYWDVLTELPQLFIAV